MRKMNGEVVYISCFGSLLALLRPVSAAASDPPGWHRCPQLYLLFPFIGTTAIWLMTKSRANRSADLLD